MISTPLTQMTNSSTMMTNELVKTLRAQGQDVIALGFGQSPFPPPPRLVAKLQEAAHRHEYLPVQGLPTLRENIAQYYSQRDGRSLTADDIVIGPGTKQLQFLLHLALKDQTVWSPTPCWVSYAAQCRVLNRPFKTFPLVEGKVPEATLQDIRETKGTQLFILTSPNNPTGLLTTPEMTARLSSLGQKGEVLFLLDEIYDQLVYPDTDHQSLAKTLPTQTIISSGTSKSLGAGGWRLGYLVFPPELAELRKAVVTLASETHSCASAPIQVACQDLFLPGLYDDYLRKSRLVLSTLMNYVVRQFAETRVRTSPPQAGWYIFLDFTDYRLELTKHGLTNSAELSRRLLEDSLVSTTLGSCFYPGGTDLINLRLCLVDFQGEEALAGLGDLGDLDKEEWLERYCPRVIEGIRRIVDWIYLRL